MNYRHLYHAGNVADVFKHVVLALILEKLRAKPTPFFVLDTHAGEGLYDLSNSEVQKTREYERGIAKLWNRENPPSALQPFLQLIRSFQTDANTLQCYPGSPAIIERYLREQDRASACEMHADTYVRLKNNICARSVSLIERDGLQAMRGLLPPKEKRGLVLIDPPYEKEEEWKQLADAIADVYPHFRQGMYAVWYPIKQRAVVQHFLRGFLNAFIPKIWVAELDMGISIPPQTGLQASGMLIINPPWQLDVQLAESMPWIISALSGGMHYSALPSYRAEWLVGE